MALQDGKWWRRDQRDSTSPSLRNGKRRPRSEERGWDTPKTPGHPHEAQEQILPLQGAETPEFFGMGWIISGIGACVNTPQRFWECGEGKAGTVSHTPHTHTLPNVPFSHPRADPSPTGTLSRHRDLVPKSSPSPRHVCTLPPSPAQLLAQVPSSAGSSPWIHPSRAWNILGKVPGEFNPRNHLEDPRKKNPGKFNPRNH